MAKQITADEWMETEKQGSGVTTEELDKLAQTYQRAYNEYEKAKAESSRLYELANDIERELISTLEKAGKSKYFVEGLGTFYFTDKLTVKTPKTIEDKKALFMYLRQKHGETVYLDKISINHQTLQALYKSEFESYLTENPDSAAAFHLPGLEAPTSMRGLSFRKAK